MVSDGTSETTRGTRVLQRIGEIVDAAGAFVLFDLGERMNQNATEGKFLNDISRSIPMDTQANSFRACFSGLIATLLAPNRMRRL